MPVPPDVGRRKTGEILYAYRVRGRDRSAVVLWVGGEGDEPDRVLGVSDADRWQLPVFVTVRQARMYAIRNGRRMTTSEVGTLELDRVQRWLEDPARRHVPPTAVLDAWNFFEDLARGLDQFHRLPQQGAVHNSAYEKLFEGEYAAWTPGEQRAVQAVIAGGVELWNSCPVITKPDRASTLAWAGWPGAKES